MGTRRRPGSPIKTTSTVFSIIEALEETGQAGVTPLADRLELAPSTVHDHLATLESEGYVVRGDDGYRLGLRFLALGVHAKRHESIAHIVQSILENVALETGEVAWYMVEEDGQSVCVECISGNGRHISRSLGNRYEFHTIATGMALLAHLPEARRTEIVEERLTSPEIDAPVDDISALYSELDTIRERGYSTRPEGTTDGVDAVGVPVLRAGRVYGAIGVSGPRYRFSGSSRDEVIRTLGEAQNEIQVRIGREDWIDHHPDVFD